MSVCSHYMPAGSKRVEIAGPHTANKTGNSLRTTAASLLTAFPPILILCPVVPLWTP